MEPQTTESQSVQAITVESVQADVNSFIHKVYGWMGAGLVITAIIAYIVGSSPSFAQTFIGNRGLFYFLLIAELLVVLYLSHAIRNISSTQAGIVFLGYSALNGLTLAVIFLIYSTASIGSVFIITAGMFLITSLYGFITKRDLTTVGNLAFMGLIGVLLASVINLFILNDHASLIISYISVVVFVALTAYDTQKIKAMNTISDMGTEREKKEAIMGALTLYLDFINLFLNLLRILGKRK